MQFLEDQGIVMKHLKTLLAAAPALALSALPAWAQDAAPAAAEAATIVAAADFPLGSAGAGKILDFSRLRTYPAGQSQ